MIALLVLVGLWSVIWKAIALWKAARNGSKPWYIVMLILNTVGILEIIYIFVISKKTEMTQGTPQAPQVPPTQAPPAPQA
ncbi:hypothetical protein HQ544_01950 [Candidatus Falkowbacteria bacterium]|nr:hypothetical protein [Candidatus Falkowbacteria bacterium]